MLPRPTPLPERDRDVDRRTTGRLLSGLVVTALLAAVPGLATAPTASAASVTAVAAAPSPAAVTGTAPTAISLSVVAGPTRGGTTVELSGTGVGATTTAWFGSTAVTRITKVSSTRVRVVTPAHPFGVVNVRVATPAGTSPVSSRATFAFDAVPSVSSLSSRSATTRGGTTVTLTGTGLYRTSAVLFGATPAGGLTRLSATQVRVTVPAHAAGAVDVRATTPGGTSPVASGARFTYTAPPVVTPPAVRGLSVSAGPLRGGTVVTLTGTRFTGATAVTFGATTARFTVLSATQLRVTSPARPAGLVNVHVRTAAGISYGYSANSFAYETVPTLTGISSAVTSRARYGYQAPPAVASLSTTAGPVRGGTVVTLTGTRFTGVTRVDFGGTPARFTFVSATSIRATTPAHAAGVVAVTVTTPYGTSPEHTSSTFAFDPVPAITSLSPQTGPPSGGTVVTLTGTGLSRATAVRFGSVAASNLVRVSATTLRATTPRHASGPVDVQVTTPRGTSATGVGARFAYGSPPVVGALSTTAGPLRGGTVVTITGAHLSDATAVRFGNVAATGLVRVSDTSLRVTAPAQAEGTVSVRVTNPNGTSPESAG